VTASQEAELRTALERLHAELRAQLASSQEAAKPVDLDQPIGRVSRIDLIQQQSMVEAGREAAKIRSQQVAAALRRMDDGEYGLCLGCGDEIEARRLSARPESPFCLRCQAAREKR